MAIQVRAFAQVREALGSDRLTVAAERAATGDDLRAHLIARHPEARSVLNAADLRLDVNGTIRPWNAPLKDGDEAALFPPFSGG